MSGTLQQAWARAGAVLAGAWLLAAPWIGARDGEPDPLAARGYGVTSGAAPGYVDDLVCGSCHTDLYQAYQEVAMARAFYRPRPEVLSTLRHGAAVARRPEPLRQALAGWAPE